MSISLLIKPLKTGGGKVVHHRMCDSDFGALPLQLLASDLTYYNYEQKEKGKARV